MCYDPLLSMFFVCLFVLNSGFLAFIYLFPSFYIAPFKTIVFGVYLTTFFQ